MLSLGIVSLAVYLLRSNEDHSSASAIESAKQQEQEKEKKQEKDQQQENETNKKDSIFNTQVKSIEL